jgi:cytochrome c
MAPLYQKAGGVIGGTASALALLSLGLLSQAAQAAFTYPGCKDVTEADFKYQAVVGRSTAVAGLKGGAVTKPLAVDGSLADPIHMAFDMQADNKANVYWVERKGKIKLFDATANTVATVGSLAVNTGNDGGLTGITLDPDFKTNKNLFLFYTASSPAEFRLSRFTLNGEGKLDNASEKILIRFPTNGQNHTGGAMQFDAYGDLWVTVGKNARDYPDSYSETNASLSTEATAANLNDYRGGVIRIHPTPDGKYTIPAGNFGEYFSNYFKEKGNATLAADYIDPAKVKQELYVKGTRNAYSISVHKTQRVLAWGEFGINTNATYSEEHNLVTHPIFGGYPYFAGGFGTSAVTATGFYSLWSGAGASVYKAAHGDLAQSQGGPVNESKWNTGPKQLPPVSPALNSYKHEPWAGAVTGPIYQWSEGSAKSGIGFPPHFDNAWFVTDWEQQTSSQGVEFQGARIYKVNSAWDKKVDSLYWFKGLGWKNPISFDQGPDGALYVLMYYCGISFSCGESGTHLGRLEYVGPACNATTGVGAPSRTRPGNGLKADLRTLEVLAAEPSDVSILDSRGRRLFTAHQSGPAKYDLGESLRSRRGVYLITLRSALGIQTVKVANL